jgi:hypothetical protein
VFKYLKGCDKLWGAKRKLGRLNWAGPFYF